MSEYCVTPKRFVVQRKSVRQEYAKKLGADFIFDPNEVNVEEGLGTFIGPDKKKHVKILVTPDQSLL